MRGGMRIDGRTVKDRKNNSIPFRVEEDNLRNAAPHHQRDAVVETIVGDFHRPSVDVCWGERERERERWLMMRPNITSDKVK